MKNTNKGGVVFAKFLSSRVVQTSLKSCGKMDEKFLQKRF